MTERIGALRRMLAAAAVVAAATSAALWAHANTLTAGFLYLLAVLVLAAWRGAVAGIAGSLLATACFNFFFLPPTGTFHIAGAENWVALASFLLASTIAGRLVAREHERAAEAESRRREAEALYDLCLDLFTAGVTPEELDSAVARALRSLGAQSGGFLPAADGASRSWVGSAADHETHGFLQRSATPGPETRHPVEIDGVPIGTLIAYGASAPRAAVDSVARLVALAVERERLLGERAGLEALRASDSLKTALLRAVSHDLSTPLTAIGLHLVALQRLLQADAEGGATLGRLAEEFHRLQRRIENLLAMARLEAGDYRPRREPSPPADLFRAARGHLAPGLTKGAVETQVQADCPDLDVDPSLIVEVLVNLLENARRSSPSGTPVELIARRAPHDPARVWLEVLDQGAGLRPGVGSGAADPASGGEPRRGLGLEIARSFAAAHGGVVTLLPRLPRGVCARVELPAAPVPAEIAR
jgi:two-component system sensor histidine kinase KdpD